MKKILSLLAAVCVTFSAAADEGMWLLPYLQKMNIKTMKERGCKLSAEEIYSVNHSSLKDAVVIFGGGCTAKSSRPKVFSSRTTTAVTPRSSSSPPWSTTI